MPSERAPLTAIKETAAAATSTRPREGNQTRKGQMQRKQGREKSEEREASVVRFFFFFFASLVKREQKRGRGSESLARSVSPTPRRLPRGPRRCRWLEEEEQQQQQRRRGQERGAAATSTTAVDLNNACGGCSLASLRRSCLPPVFVIRIAQQPLRFAASVRRWTQPKEPRWTRRRLLFRRCVFFPFFIYSSVVRQENKNSTFIPLNPPLLS